MSDLTTRFGVINDFGAKATDGISEDKKSLGLNKQGVENIKNDEIRDHKINAQLTKLLKEMEAQFAELRTVNKQLKSQVSELEKKSETE